MTKQCEIVQDLLPLYVDGACSEASAEMIKEHLETCADCRAIYEQMRSHTNEDILQKEKDGVIARREKTEKKKSRKRIVLVSALSIVLCCAIIFACVSLKPATIDYGASDIYSKADMDSAIELIKDKFDSWEGCKLYSISYTADSFCERELDYCNTLADDGIVYDQCIVFRTSFRSPIFGGGAWNANYNYDWSWYLARSANGDWDLLTWGMP